MNKFNSSLGELADPSKFHLPLLIDGQNDEILLTQLRTMAIIRKAEQQLASGRKEGLIGGPVHLSVGQEAIAVGVSSSLRKTDRVFGAHRSHSHLLALNPDIYRLFSEVLGKESGFSKGMGGSMHLWDQPNGFFGSVPIVAGTVALAVGAGLAAKMQKNEDVAVVYFGDGAVEEGVVHESLNFARIQDVPVLFVVENNLFASHLHISLRQPSDRITRFAKANEIPYKCIDGNDVVEVTKVAEKMVANARTGKGPSLLEVVTYRWYGHVDWREDIDVGVHRSLTEVESWRARDPLRRLSTAMMQSGFWSEDQNELLDRELTRQIKADWERALAAPYPAEKATLECVYARTNDE
jgi:TPP-dependent pyruvate/acetoin dehydrogenase alpha subunit